MGIDVKDDRKAQGIEANTETDQVVDLGSATGPRVDLDSLDLTPDMGPVTTALVFSPSGMQIAGQERLGHFDDGPETVLDAPGDGLQGLYSIHERASERDDDYDGHDHDGHDQETQLRIVGGQLAGVDAVAA